MEEKRRTTLGLPFVVLLAAMTAFFFGAVIKVATADHYHTAGYCGAPNGLVHGSSTTDQAYHARIELGNCPPTHKYCAVYNSQSGGALNYAETYDSTCNAFTSWNGAAECHGYAVVDYEVVFGQHNHLAHNWCG
jgi:hypothetical protein